MTCSLAAGMLISFSYPRDRKRRIRVSRIADVREEPGEVAVALDPLLALDRWLIHGNDVDGGGELSFFLSSPRPDALAPALPGPWRVFLVDHDGSSPELVHEAQDVAEAASWAEEWNARNRELLAVLCPPDKAVAVDTAVIPTTP